MQPPEGNVSGPTRAGRARAAGGGILRAEAVALALAWLGIVIAFTALSPLFLSVPNFLNIGRAVAVTGIVACGTTIALISGALDLSIASVMNFAAVITGTLSISGVPAPVAIVVAIVAGTLVGVGNGLIVTRLRINPIIATLATAGIVQGATYLLTNNVAQLLDDPAFKLLGRSDVFGLPTSLLLFVAAVVVTYIVLRYTRFGRMVYAIGGNAVASGLAGINVDRWRLLFFTASSLSASIAGILLLSRIGAVIPDAASGTELGIIAAVILGGTSLSGGAGSVQGTVLGVLILGTLSNGQTLLNLNAYWQQIIAGTVLVIAVAADRLRTGGYR
jgi:ribose transport system permease protein